MLVLTRRIGEQLLIGDDIVVEVIRVDEDRVRIGIQAPLDLRILRLPEHGEKRLTGPVKPDNNAAWKPP